MQIITFTLGDKYYAIYTDKVDEICDRIDSIMVPNSPNWVKGIINLRGSVVTLIDLSKLLRLDDSLCYNNIIVIHNEDDKIGLMVKDVIEVRDLQTSEIQKISHNDLNVMLGIVTVDERIINIIDIDGLLFKNEG